MYLKTLKSYTKLIINIKNLHFQNKITEHTKLSYKTNETIFVNAILNNSQ